MSSAGRDQGLPHALDTERLILGGILLGSPFDAMAQVLDAEDFTTQAHKIIWRRMAEIAATGEALDRVVLAHVLMQNRELESVGGLTYLTELDTGLPKLPNLAAYAKIVKEKANLRRVIFACNKSMNQAMLAQDESADISADLIQNVSSITAPLGRQSNFSLGDVTTDAPGINKLLVPATGVPTGFIGIDRLTYGLVKGEVYVIGADTTTGKSAFALNIAHNVARDGTGVIYFSLEMGKESLVRRLLAARARVSLERINRRETTLIDRACLLKAAELVGVYPLYFNDNSNTSVVDFYRHTSHMIREKQVGLAIIDYLQIMDWQSGRHGMPKFTKEYEAIAYETRAFKEYARTLQIPVIVVSQLNRARTLRSAKDLRPKLRDLHGGSSIEKDADVVMLLYREELDRPSEPHLKGEAEVIIAKNRGGRQGTVYLKFNGDFTEFTEPGSEPGYDHEAVA